MPHAFLAIDESYDETTGSFRMADGSFDCCHTERPVCHTWYCLARLCAAHNILETGTYHGYSTCHLAAAVRDNGRGRVITIDPWDLPHLWEASNLDPYVHWIPKTSQEAASELLEQRFDMLVIDSVHTYAQSSWELAQFEPLLRPGGLILLHDSLLHDGVGCSVSQLVGMGRFEAITFDTPRKVAVESLTSGSASMGFSILRKRCDGEPMTQIAELLNMPEHPPDGPEPVLRQMGSPSFRAIPLVKEAWSPGVDKLGSVRLHGSESHKSVWEAIRRRMLGQKTQKQF